MLCSGLGRLLLCEGRQGGEGEFGRGKKGMMGCDAR